MKKKNKAIEKPINVEEILMFYENKALKQELFSANAELSERKRKCAEQKKAAQKEIDSIMCFVGLVALLVVFGCCMMSSAPWTAVFVAIGYCAVMKRGGWF